ncbi:protein Transporter, Pam16 [Artemisia annua]|uniref:Protein Transporter, Pam16 n=1 Tax=Artemisia annua TaxID=35608 RepID=A0A2U1PPX6_ARTAN|nr:protein Transporter, Pam16 [Artemisia annua]
MGVLVVNDPNEPRYERMQAARILANLLVLGGGILARGMVQAYRQALQNASKTGVAQETMQNAVRRGSKAMTELEARQILGVTEKASWEEIAQAIEGSPGQGMFGDGLSAKRYARGERNFCILESVSNNQLTYLLNLLQKYDKLFERNATNGSFYLQSKVHRAKECLETKYDKLFERNATNGSFYLQSKVHRAKECLETVYQPKDMPGGPMG